MNLSWCVYVEVYLGGLAWSNETSDQNDLKHVSSTRHCVKAGWLCVRKSRVMCIWSTSLCMFWLSLNPRWRAFTIANIYPCQRRSTAALICISTVLVILHLFLDYAFFHGTGRNSSPWHSSTKRSLDDVSFPLTFTIIQRYGVWPNQHHPYVRELHGDGDDEYLNTSCGVIVGMETRGLHRVGGVYVGLVPCSMQTVGVRYKVAEILRVGGWTCWFRLV